MNWLLVIFFPLTLALLILHPRINRSAVRLLAALAPIPALTVALAAEPDSLEYISWLLFGTWFGFGEIGPVFLFFTALLWWLAAIYAAGYLQHDGRQKQFFCFFLLTMSGNCGLLIVQDIASFYVFFALMTFSAYGLVVHTRTTEAQRAGRVYLMAAIFGELLLVTAIYLAVQASPTLLISDVKSAAAESPLRPLILGFALTGFGVKAGAFLVHFWLPLAHPVAPVPASAILSGTMIKAGLVGWIHFLPLGEIGLANWGFFLLLAGIIAAFYGVVIGLFQNDPKTILAYSSISQMGAMTMAVGIGLSAEEAWLPSLLVLQIYALNHALAKGALFLGVGMAAGVGPGLWKRRIVLAGLIFPALAIAGAPWTGGAMAKHALKQATGFAPDEWYPWLEWLLPLASVATTLLLTRFVLLTWNKAKSPDQHAATPAMWTSWCLLLIGVAGATTFAIHHFALQIEASPASPADLWNSLWPVLLGVAALLLLRRVLPGRVRVVVPPGDVVVWVEHAARLLNRCWRRLGFGEASPPWEIKLRNWVAGMLQREREARASEKADAFLYRWETAGLGFVLLILLFLAVL